jgi:tetratricopeptide (TPR) repeat protein
MANVALTERADCLTDLGRHDEAAATYLQAIAVAEQTNDVRQVAASKGQLATVRRKQRHYSAALRLYTEVLDVFERLNEPAMVATAWHQIGTVYEATGQVEAAEQAYQKALSIKVQIGNRAAQASTLGQFGNLYSTKGRRDDAVRLYRQAADIAIQVGDLRSEGRLRNNIAGALISLRRYDEARLEVERAIECKKPFGHVAEPWTTFDILFDLERAVGNQPAALEAHSRAFAAYLAYRRDGGAPQMDTTQLIEMVKRDSAARAALDDADVSYAVAAEITLALENLNP